MAIAAIKGQCVRCGKEVRGHPDFTPGTLRLTRRHMTPDGFRCSSTTARVPVTVDQFNRNRGQ